MRSLKKIYNRIISTEGKRTALENFLFLSSSQLATLLIQLITAPYLIRTVGPEKYGLIAFAHSFVQYFILVDNGFNFSATKEISIVRNQEDKIRSVFSAVTLIRFLLLMVSFLITCIVVLSFDKFKNDWLLYFISFGAVLGNFLFPFFLFQGLEKMGYILSYQSLALLLSLSVFVVVKSEADFLYIPLINSLGMILSSVVVFWLNCQKFKIRFYRPDFGHLRHQLKQGWNVIIANLAWSIYSNSRIFAMGLFTTNIITGYYAIAERIMNLGVAFPLSAFVNATYPRLNRAYSQDKKEAWRLTLKLQDVITAIYVVIAMALFVFAPLWVRLFAGFPYPEAVVSSRLLSVGLFLTAASIFRVYFFIICGRSDLFAKLCILCSLAGSVFTFMLAPYLSYWGVALIFILTMLLVLGLTLKYKKEVVDDHWQEGDASVIEKLRRHLALLRIKLKKPIARVAVQNILLSMDLRDEGVGRKLYIQRSYETVETAFFRRITKEGMAVIDVGAHIGYFTTLFASAVGKSGKVFAMEPDPHNFKLLERNIQENHFDNVKLFHCALGSKQGEAKLYFSPTSNQGDHRLYDDGESVREFIKVATDTIDHILEGYGHRVDLIKIDVQGYEQQVLEGAVETLKANPDLILLTEFWPYGLEKAGGSAKKFFTLLSQAGFMASLLTEKGPIKTVSLEETLSLLPEFDPTTPDEAYLNLIFHKRHHPLSL